MKREKLLRLNLFPGSAILLIVFLLGTTGLVLMLRHQQTGKMQTALDILQNSNQPTQQVGRTLGLLYQSEMDFRQYTLTYDKEHLSRYREDVRALKLHIDTLIKMVPASNPNDEKVMADQLQTRRKETENYVRISRLTDSLMIVMTVFDSLPLTRQDETMPFRAFTIEDSKIDIDTISLSTVTTTAKKGLFGKIKSFLVGDKETKVHSSQTKTVVKSDKSSKTDTVSAPTNSIRNLANILIDRGNDFYKKQINQIIRNRMRQKAAEQRLIASNTSLMQEIKVLLDELQEGFREDELKSTNSSVSAIGSSATVLHNLLLAAIVGVFALALIVIYMLRRASKDNVLIKASEDKAVKESAEKSRFLAYMSHEFRSPVSLVLGYTEQMEQTSLLEEQRRYMECLKTSSQTLLATVNDVLDLSALEAGRLTFVEKPFAPEKVLKEIVTIFEQQAAQKQLTLHYKPSERPLIVAGDELRLRQVATNLISNAIKYTREGVVTVTSSMEAKEGKIVLYLIVTDTGIGISEDKLSQIFDEYRRVHDVAATNWVVGSGLGLPITRLLVEQMGGAITARSNVAKGTEMSVSIPYKPFLGEVEEKPMLTPSSPGLPAQLKILVADDNDLNLSLLQTILGREKISVDVAANGLIALEKLRSGSFDMLLTDRYMPSMDGISLAKKIRALNDPKVKNIPIILLSGEITRQAEVEIRDAGINGYLLKPYKQHELLEMIVAFTAK